MKFDEPVGKGATTLDFLFAKYSWLKGYIKECEREAFCAGFEAGADIGFPRKKGVISKLAKEYIEEEK